MSVPHFDADEVRAALNADAAAIVRAVLGEPNAALSNRRSLRFGNKGSKSVEVEGPKCGTWFDHETREGGDLFDLIDREYQCGGDFPTIVARAAALTGVSPKPPNSKAHPPAARRHVAATPIEAWTSPTTFPLWTPPNEHGRPKFIGDPAIPPKYGTEIRRHIYCRGAIPVLVRIKRNDAPAWLPYWRVRNAHGTVGWQSKKPTSYRAVPYIGAIDPFDPELAADQMYWPEGEKDVDTLGKINAPAFTFGGTGDGLPIGAEQFARERHVVIIADNDPAGRDHAEQKAALCAPVAASVRVIHFPELSEKGDVSDWIALGHGLEELEARADTTPLWQPPGRETPPDRPNAIKSPKSSILVCAKDIVMREKDWLWPGHLLRGAQEILTGLPGVGKSQVQCDLVARASRGDSWPDGTHGMPPAKIIMLTAEDCLDQEVVPRLVAAGADLEKIVFLTRIRHDNGSERMFLLGEDIDELERAIRLTGDVGLVSIDPITAYMGKVDSHKATEVRGQLAPLQSLAERTNVTFSTITHPPKGGATQRAIDQFIGSQAFIAACRIGHVAIEEVIEGQKTGRVLFTNPKNNPHIKMPTLAYRIVQRIVGQDRRSGSDIIGSHIVWDADPVETTADQALAAAAGKDGKDKATEKNAAVEFLGQFLANGRAAVPDVQDAAVAAGLLTEKQSIGQSKPFREARKKLQIKPYQGKGDQAGVWFWELRKAGQMPSGESDALSVDRASGVEGASDPAFGAGP
jgi:putative DNA primase/helicase